MNPLKLEKITNLYGERNDLYRIETIADGSSFFHSLLTPLDLFYKKLSLSNKQKYVRQLRILITKKMTLQKWKELGSEEVAQTQFVKLLIKLMKCDLSYKQFLKIIPNIVAGSLHDWKIKFLLKSKSSLKSLLNKVETLAYQLFLQSIQDKKGWISHDTIELFSQLFHVNICIISNRTRTPLVIVPEKIVYPKSIVML